MAHILQKEHWAKKIVFEVNKELEVLEKAIRLHTNQER